MKPHALLVDDDVNSRRALGEFVEREGFTTSHADTLEEARRQLREKLPDLVLLDLVLPDGSGMELLGDGISSECESGTSAQVVVVTGHATVQTAVDALRSGACDYLVKPIDTSRLRTVLANVARTRELQQEVGRLREELRELGRFGALVGISPAMQKVYDVITKVAPTNATVLLSGESGTGKDLVAQTLHDLSRRRKGPFLPVNCGAITANLIESELFGHERGSFTGADRMHRGYFERASGGTLLLDEITETPIEFQIKLLRVLETSTILRVGGERPIEVDVRVVATTNRRPEEEVAKGKLREDLLYRIKVFSLELPTLSERRQDIPLLAEYFLAALNKSSGTDKQFSATTLERLKRHDWPGNVRELKNVVEHAFILAGDEIAPECLPEEVGDEVGDKEGSRSELSAASGEVSASVHFKIGTTIAEAERRLILATLEQYGGDKKFAAEALGISLKTLYNRLNAYKPPDEMK